MKGHELPDHICIRPARREDDGSSLAALLDEAFPETFDGRTYYKQQPHHRFLAFDQGRLVGHIGLDLRIVTVVGKPYEVVGIIDLCVAENRRGQGIGTALIKAAEDFDDGRDFAILFADDPSIYETNGYQRIVPANTRWFAIDELQSHSVIDRDLSDCFMAKSMGSTPWPSGKIDLLGYLF